mgnify:FL=1
MNKKNILRILLIIVCVLGAICSIYIPNSKLNDAIKETENIIINEIKVSEQTEELAIQTKESINNDEIIETQEVIQSSEEEEQEVNDESALETDGVVEQENISYDGVNTGNGLNLLGKYQGLTYYSQADSRWANTMYSSINDKSQTMKTSACGPTSAAMVVSSSKGAILPTTIANLFVDNGYRTARNGTAWSAYSFVADYFDFAEYHSTGNFEKAMNYLAQKRSDNSTKYFIIVSCGSGLFTTGGHYIVLTSLDNDTIEVYDPYVYSSKFKTASRKNANVKLHGNIAYVSKTNFAKYANYKNFWVFSNDSAIDVEDTKKNTKVDTSYKMYVNTKIKNLNVRKTPNGVKVGSLKKGTAVTVYETSGGWSKIGTNKWVSSDYLASYITEQKNIAKTEPQKYTTGKYKVNANLNVRKGAGTNYPKKTYRQLSSNANLQNRKLGGLYNGYRKGVVCTVTKIKGNWGLTNSGWICLNYCKKI